MRFKINEIGDGGLPVRVSVTAEWLASACPDFDATLFDDAGPPLVFSPRRLFPWHAWEQKKEKALSRSSI